MDDIIRKRSILQDDFYRQISLFDPLIQHLEPLIRHITWRTFISCRFVFKKCMREANGVGWPNLGHCNYSWGVLRAIGIPIWASPELFSQKNNGHSPSFCLESPDLFRFQNPENTVGHFKTCLLPNEITRTFTRSKEGCSIAVLRPHDSRLVVQGKRFTQREVGGQFLAESKLLWKGNTGHQ